jgi:Fur family transcriptional regulator, ferric uptake regulator
MQDKDLRDVGLKVTAPRLKILSILENADHISAEDIFHKLKDVGEDVGLATVYRVLTQFESAGLVIRHNFEEGHSVFELESGQHHDHMVCVKCKKVVEFFDEHIELRQLEIAQSAGFELTDHSLTMYGICQSCQQ